jgi:hypothetical protein
VSGDDNSKTPRDRNRNGTRRGVVCGTGQDIVAASGTGSWVSAMKNRVNAANTIPDIVGRRPASDRAMAPMMVATVATVADRPTYPKSQASI